LSTTVALIPIVSNKKLYGVIELYLIKNLEKKYIQLIEIVTKNIATSLQSILNQEHTKKLLEELQEKTLQMETQEMVMREHLETLLSTQEEMHQRQIEVAKLLEEVNTKEANLNALINNSDDIVFAIDQNYKLTIYNQAFMNFMQVRQVRLDIGMNIFATIPAEQHEVWKLNYQRAMTGERFRIEFETKNYDFKDLNEKIYHEITFNPIINDKQKIIGVSVFSRDITLRKRNELEKLRYQNEQLKETQEELKQNLEELVTTQEEMQGKQKIIHELLDQANQKEKELQQKIQALEYQLQECKTQNEQLKADYEAQISLLKNGKK
jgi:PAS domain S-box-containing protein